MKILTGFFLAILIFCTSGFSQERVMKFYVSTEGNDSWSGKISKPNRNLTDGPFLTLQRAIDETKRQKQFPVIIEIMQGTYEVFNKIQIDSCRDILIKGAGKNVVFTGGKKIENWEKVKDPLILDRLDENIKNHIVTANLKESGITDFGDFHQPSWAISSGSQIQLYFNGKPMQIARWSDEGFALTGEIAGKGKFFCDAGRERIEKWSKEKSLKAYGYWFYEWAAQHMEIESVDSESGVISIKKP